MNIDEKKFDETQLKYFAMAKELQTELVNNGFMASRIVKGEDRTDFSVIFFDGEHDYIVRRDYDKNIFISRIVLEAKEKEAQEKVKDFFSTLALAGVTPVYRRKDYQDEKSDIRSGELVKNGICYSFEIHQDGYISQKISIDYRVNDTLENFLLLSENNFKKN